MCTLGVFVWLVVLSSQHSLLEVCIVRLVGEGLCSILVVENTIWFLPWGNI